MFTPTVRNVLKRKRCEAHISLSGCVPTGGSTCQRSISSGWTPISISHLPSSQAQENGTNKSVTLHICQQFMSPPGGATVDTTGRRIWPTSEPFLQYLLQHKLQKNQLVPKQKEISILELGAGCGLISMGLAALFPANIVATDQSTEWLAENVQYNRHLFPSKSIQVEPLRWGNMDDTQSILAALSKKNVKSFDYIVGSDLLYNPASHAPLLSTLEAFARNSPTTKIVLAYPQRMQDEESFLLNMKSSTLRIEAIEPLSSEDRNERVSSNNNSLFAAMTLSQNT